MNSVQQTILGLVLVGIAFVFGSHLHNDRADKQVAEDQSSEMENIAWQSQGKADASTKNIFGNQPQSSSMPRLQSSKLVEANLVPDLDKVPSAEAESPARKLEIAVPDFSRFAFDSPATESKPLAVRGEVRDTQVPDFESYFPENALASAEQIEPRMPQRDISPPRNMIDNDLTVVQRRVDFEPNQSYQAPPNPNHLRSGLSSNQNKPTRVRPVQPINTQTAVTAIRPRTQSPVMMNATEYLNHETVRGETLQQLAVKYFGDAAYYLDIYVANKQVLRDPSEVPAGVNLRIPVYK
jgi:hypothetical protein